MSHTTVAEGRTFEALVGGDDTDHINFLTRGWRAGRSAAASYSATRQLVAGSSLALASSSPTTMSWQINALLA